MAFKIVLITPGKGGGIRGRVFLQQHGRGLGADHVVRGQGAALADFRHLGVVGEMPGDGIRVQARQHGFALEAGDRTAQGRQCRQRRGGRRLL